MVKAYYQKLAETTKHENPDIPEEVLQVSLNPDASNVPYTLGRLFSVLEAIQASANPASTPPSRTSISTPPPLRRP
ncbi:MAG: type I-C CRISPR-associated protein Cas8c/Csd1 [Dysosmobacter welbionis]